MKASKNMFLLFIVYFGFFTTNAFAQPSFYSEGIIVNTNDIFEVDIKTDNLTNITKIELSFGWDKNKIQFQDITAVYLDEMDIDNSFDLSLTNTEGKLGVLWVSSDLNVGETLPDESPIFRVRFKAISPLSTIDIIHYVDEPVATDINRTSSGPMNIGAEADLTHEIVINGLDIPPLQLNTSPYLIESGTSICVPVTANNFDALVAAQFSVNFDETVLEFVSVQNYFSSEFETASTFGGNAAAGFLVYSWFNSSGSTTIPDNVTLFELCFNAIGEGGDFSPIDFSNEPAEAFIVSEESEQIPDNNIGLVNNGDTVTVFELPFEGVYMDMNTQNGTLAEVVCLDLTVSDFNDIISMQYTLTWDPNVVAFAYVENLNLVGLNAGSFASGIEGNLLCSWNNNNTGVTLPDNTVIGQVCFTIIGPPGSSTEVEITSDYTPIHVTSTGSNGGNIKIKGVNGLINVVSVVPQAIILDVESTSVFSGDSDCLAFSVSDFNGVTNLNFTLAWSTSVGAYLDITNIAPGLSMGNFDINNVADGQLSIQYSGPPLTIADGSVLFELCLTGVGTSGSLTVLGITNDMVDVFVTKQASGDTDVGINNSTNGTFEIIDVSEFAIDIRLPDVTGFQGQQICVDVDVSKFFGVTSIEYTVEWNPSIVNYTGSSDFQIATSGLIDIDDSQVANGKLTYSWTAPDGVGVTLIGGKLFTMCFDLIGNVGDETPLNFTSSLTTIRATKEAYGNQNVGLDINNGSIKITRNPDAMILMAEDAITVQNHQVCVDYFVDNFEEMFTFQFTLSWDINVLSFTSFDAYGLTNGGGSNIYGANLADALGYITVAWNDPPIGGLTLDDGTTLFTVCFDAIGEPGTLSDIVIDGSHTAQEAVNIDFNEVDIIDNQPTITIVDYVSIDNADIHHVDCTGDNSASIDLDISGGVPPLYYMWSNSEVTQDLIDLAVGTYSVTIYDSGIIPDTLITSFDIVFVDNSPLAEAEGNQTEFGCDSQIITLGGDNTSQGNNISYNWMTTDGHLLGDPNSFNPTADALGEYTLIVVDNNTNCMDTSTVILSGEIYPKAQVIDNFTTCDTSATISATEFAGTMGEWISYADAVVEDPLSASTLVEGLSLGQNMFTWVLSTANCAEYDADTVVVTVSGYPNALPDNIFLESGDSPYLIDVVENDDLSQVEGYTLTQTSLPNHGTIEIVDGQFEYTVSDDFIGDDGFNYTVCNEFCPNKCDETFVVLSVYPKPLNGNAQIPNTITPNGDGVNDALVFDELLINATLYPNNTFTVVNRWGDVVFFQDYYTNDWEGTNKTGQPLAEGTYYYVLQLNLSEGLIYAGDITIIR